MTVPFSTQGSKRVLAACSAGAVVLLLSAGAGRAQVNKLAADLVGAAANASRVQQQQVARRPDLTAAPRSAEHRAGSSPVAKNTAPRTAARLGVVLKDNTPIYRKPDAHSQQLYRCGKGTALGLVGQTKRYYAVLMIDHSYGFVDKARVQLHNYGVALDPRAAHTSERIIQVALQYIGVPYVWGGNTRAGIDCSGFVKAVFHQTFGVELPRVARDQYNVGRPVAWSELAPGDRLYFCSHGATIDHTGIYIGGGRFIHASGSAGAVVVSSVTEPKYYRTLVGAKRSL